MRKTIIKFKNKTLSEKYLFIAFNFALLFSIGFFFNFLVITSNGGRMPVMYNESYSDDTHFTYKDVFTVEYWFLSDIFATNDFIFSIGDTCIWIGVPISILFYFLYLRSKIKFVKGGKK